MSRSILTVWRPVLLTALLALAAAPTSVRAAGHSSGFHGGGYHAGGFHPGGFHYGGYQAGGYRPGYFSGYHNGYEHHDRGYGYYGGYFPSLYGSPAYLSGGYDMPPYDYSAGDSAAAPDYGVSAYYSPDGTIPTPPATTPAPDPNATPGPGTVDVHVPTSAQVWFDDSPTHESGDWRRFETPSLPEGKPYQYDVRARWTEDGRTTEQTRRVTVRAYHVTEVDFTAPTPAAKAVE